MKTIQISSHQQVEMIDMTAEIRSALRELEISDGILHLFVPHTTAAVTINESADPDVVEDMVMELNKVIPFQDRYLHSEGNSAAHIKTSLVGSSECIFIENGQLMLGTWQGIFLCEFDGPRTRQIWVKTVTSE